MYRQISVAAEERYQPWSQRLRSRVLPTGVAVADLVFKDAGIVRGGRRGEGGEETSKGGWIVTGWGGGDRSNSAAVTRLISTQPTPSIDQTTTFHLLPEIFLYVGCGAN